MNLSIDERRIKQLFKEALVEVIEERRSVFPRAIDRGN